MMETPGDAETLIEDIFDNDEVNYPQLKEFLKILANQSKLIVNVNAHGEEALSEDEYEEDKYDRIFEADYLSRLITQCEERLANLIKTPKKKIVIRNEGQKLQSIIDSVEAVKCTNENLQRQIDQLFEAQENLKKLACEKVRQNYHAIDDVEQNCMRAEICKLRVVYYGVQNQVDELIVKTNDMEQDIQDIKEKLKIVDRISLVEEKVAELLSWQSSLREELELFVERYEHLKTVKANTCEVQDLLEQKVDFCHLSKYIRSDGFNAAKREFAEELEELKELFCELQLNFTAKLVALQKNVQLVFSMLASKRRTEKKL